MSDKTRTIRHRNVGTCSSEVIVVLEGNVVKKIKFVGGCVGNTQAVSRLAAGKTVEELIKLLSGIQCQNGTSCPDQLARALTEALRS